MWQLWPKPGEINTAVQVCRSGESGKEEKKYVELTAEKAGWLCETVHGGGGVRNVTGRGDEHRGESVMSVTRGLGLS